SSVRCVWFRISQSLRRALHVWLTLRRPKQRNANPLLGPVAFVLASAAVGATSGACAPTTRSAAACTSAAYSPLTWRAQVPVTLLVAQAPSCGGADPSAQGSANR